MNAQVARWLNISGAVLGLVGLVLVWTVSWRIGVGAFLLITGNNFQLAVKIQRGSSW